MSEIDTQQGDPPDANSERKASSDSGQTQARKRLKRSLIVGMLFFLGLLVVNAAFGFTGDGSDGTISTMKRVGAGVGAAVCVFLAARLLSRIS